MKNQKRGRVGMLVLSALCLFLNGCQSKSGISTSPLSLKVRLVSEPMSLDPALAEDGVSFEVLQNLGEGLVGYDSLGQLENRLAQRVEVTQGGRRYEFTLRKNLKWSDGEPLLAQHFVQSLRRILHPQTLSKLSPLFHPIRGSVPYSKGLLSEQSLGVREEGGRVVIELERPNPYWIHVLALPQAFPIRKEILDAHHGMWPESAPVVGPYRLSNHLVEEKIVLERNPYYWQNPPHFEKIEFYIIANETTGLHLFESGRLDVLTRLSSAHSDGLRKKNLLRTDPFFATYYVTFNCTQAPFQDRVWRRAIAGAIHREEITQLMGAGERPAWSLIPYGLTGYAPYQDPKLVFKDSMQEVRKQMEKGHKIQAAFDSQEKNMKIMEKVQHDLKAELGMNVSIANLEWKTYMRQMQAQASPIFRMGILASFHDPVSMLVSFTSGNPQNLSRCSIPEYDQLVKKIESMSPGKDRERLILQAQKVLLEDEAVLVPIYHYVSNTGVSHRIKKLQMSPFGVIFYRDVE